MSNVLAADIHDAVAMRRADAGTLSLALMDARNHSLRWLAAFDAVQFAMPPAGFDPPAWLAGQAGWFQEFWIARHVQRNRGEAADAQAPRLASIHPPLDAWLDARICPRTRRWDRDAPDAADVRAYLEATLEATLELLDKADDSDDALYYFRLALLHEDRLGEALAVIAQAVDLPVACQQGLWPDLPVRMAREPLAFNAQRVQLGSAPGGLVPDNEKWAHEVALPEFQIDAQAVSWAEYAEFVDDHGYDEPGWWSPEGWDWVEATVRRAPRYVEQLAGGVLLRRQGRMQRVPGQQAAVHLSWYEADAWCRWADRRLPTEAEWSLAAANAAARGLAWGDVFEWVAGTPRRYPGHKDGPARLDAVPTAPDMRVLRGASFASAPRQRHPAARRFAPAQADHLLAGFRSCAV